MSKKKMKGPIRTTKEPDKDFWVISASSEKEAREILKKRIMNFYNLTEQQYKLFYENP